MPHCSTTERVEIFKQGCYYVDEQAKSEFMSLHRADTPDGVLVWIGEGGGNVEGRDHFLAIAISEGRPQVALLVRGAPAQRPVVVTAEVRDRR